MEHMEKNQEMEKSGCGCACAESQSHETARIKEPAAEKTPRRTYAPAVDIIDSEGEIMLIADIPGVPEGAVDLELKKDLLSLAAVPSDGVIAGKKLAYSEYGVGEYRRSFSLSEDIDKENISASLRNGVLRIRLPKIKPVARKINISVS